jgi:hypothetical protein
MSSIAVPDFETIKPLRITDKLVDSKDQSGYVALKVDEGSVKKSPVSIDIGRVAAWNKPEWVYLAFGGLLACIT